MWFLSRDMWLLAVLTVCGLLWGQDGGSLGAPLHGSDSAQRTHAAGPAGLRRAVRELLPEETSLCVSENEERQLLCNDRRSHFNFNPFGLRFGKRQSSYMYSRALRRATTNNYLPLSLFSTELLPT